MLSPFYMLIRTYVENLNVNIQGSPTISTVSPMFQLPPNKQMVSNVSFGILRMMVYKELIRRANPFP